MNLTFSWLNASILFMAVSKAVMDSRKAGSCSHSGLLSRSAEIFTAALDMAECHTYTRQRTLLKHRRITVSKKALSIFFSVWIPHVGGYLNASLKARRRLATKVPPIVKIREVGRAACSFEYSPVHQEFLPCFFTATFTVNLDTWHFVKAKSTFQIRAALRVIRPKTLQC